MKRKSTEIHIEREDRWFKVRVSEEMMDTFKQVILDGALQRGVDVTFIHSAPQTQHTVTINTLSAADYERLMEKAESLPLPRIPMGGGR